MIKYSPTQLSMFVACPRKWHYSYPLGFRAPQSASQAIGTEIHAQIERALKAGVVPEDERARCGLAVIDDGFDIDKDPIGVELDVEIALPPARDGTTRAFVGVIDLFDGRDPLLPIVTDHKTTSDMKYAKTSYELAEDVQLISYAQWSLSVASPDAREVIVRHNVIPTRGAPKAVVTHARLSRAHVSARWSTYLPILDAMDDARPRSSAEVDPLGMRNGECERYGGCHHRARCLSAIFSSSLTEVSQQSNLATPQPTEPKGTEMSANAIPLADRLAALRAKGAAQPAPATHTAVIPPPPTPSTPPVATPPPATNVAADKLAALRARAAASTQPTPAAPAPTTPAAPPTDIKARLAALKSAQTPPTTNAQQAQAHNAAVASSAIQTVAVPPYAAPASSGARIKLLLVNCVAQKGIAATALDDLVAPILAQIVAATGLSWAVHDFGKGKGYVVDGVNALAALPDTLAVDSRTPLGGAVIEALVARADVVVRGIT